MSTAPVLYQATPLSTYLSRVTSEHSDKPKFMAKVAAEVQPYVDLQAVLASMVGIFNASATGDQLDKFGQWVGQSRVIETPITGVFFSFDTAGLGWDQGNWLPPGVSNEQLTTLEDSDYQILLKLTIAKNMWDGTIPGAYTIFNLLFQAEGFQLLINDGQNMTMEVVILGQMSLVTKALLSGGYFNLRPAGVQITSISEPSVPGALVFGFDIENSTIAGWDQGAWLTSVF